jgi:hypothetical protein
MTDIAHLVEQHILEHESRRKHLDELLATARERAAQSPERAHLRSELEAIEKERDRLTVRLDELKLKDLDEWRQEEIEKSGLMGIWDAVAQQAEELVERLEK